MAIDIPWNCSECGQQFPFYGDMVTHRDSAHPEWAASVITVEELVPTCDYCAKPADGALFGNDVDWNGETGNHLTCEVGNVFDASSIEADPMAAQRRGL